MNVWSQLFHRHREEMNFMEEVEKNEKAIYFKSERIAKKHLDQLKSIYKRLPYGRLHEIKQKIDEFEARFLTIKTAEKGGNYIFHSYKAYTVDLEILYYHIGLLVNQIKSQTVGVITRLREWFMVRHLHSTEERDQFFKERQQRRADRDSARSEFE